MFAEVFVFALVAGILPGPDFFVVSKNAISHGTRVGIGSAIGVASALAIHATYSILGLTVIMQNYHFLFVTIQLFGAAYLAYLGLAAIISTFKKKAIEEGKFIIEKNKTFSKGYFNGFVCNILNPKAYAFFLSVFSQFMSPTTPLWVEWLYGAEVVVVIGLWFILLSVLVSSGAFKRIYQRLEKAIERIFGAILILFAVKIGKSAIFGD
ncbi:MAG: LysE family transporter [Bacteroidota bacterium]